MELSCGAANIDSSFVDNGSTDNCLVATITVSPNAFTSANVGDNTVTAIATDENGNSANCTAVVTIASPGPVAACQDATVYLDGAGTATVTSGDIDNGSTSSAGIDFMTATPNTFGCANVGDETVSLIVTDNVALTDTCTATVSIFDTIAPTASCQNITVYLDANGDASIVAADVDLSLIHI